MAYLRQLLRSNVPSSSLVASRAAIPALSHSFLFQAKAYLSTDGHEGVAEINSVVDAEEFASSAPETETEEDSSLFSRPRVANLPEDLTPEQLEQFAEKNVPKEREKAVNEEGGYPALVKDPLAKKKRSPILLVDAIRKLKASARKNFDETVEAHVRLGIDPRRSDQNVRGAATLPNGIGKVVRVAVFAEGAQAVEAETAGADVVGADELVAAVQESGGKVNFDKCIATPSFMPKLGKIARILGPRGLMPNPRVGSVTTNIGEAVRAAKLGRVDFRADKTGIVHAGLGKVSFHEEALIQNIAAFTGALLAAKPTGLKKTSRYAGYVNSFVLSSTMGTGLRVSLQSVIQATDSFSKSADVR